MDVEELVEINKGLKRRLIPTYRKGRCILLNARSKKVTAVPFGLPIMISVIRRGMEIKGEKVYANFSTSNGCKHVKEAEARIILGYDYLTAHDEEDVSAMLEATQAGPGLTNAYILGGSTHFFERTKTSDIPVTYLQINPEVHKSLAIDLRDSKFKEALEEVRAKYSTIPL